MGPVMGLLPPGLSSLGPVLQTVGRAGEAILPVIPAGQRSELGLERSLPWCPSSGSRLAQPCPGQERRVPFFPQGSRIGDGGRSLRKRKHGCSFIMDAAPGCPLERLRPDVKCGQSAFRAAGAPHCGRLASGGLRGCDRFLPGPKGPGCLDSGPSVTMCLWPLSLWIAPAGGLLFVMQAGDWGGRQIRCRQVAPPGLPGKVTAESLSVEGAFKMLACILCTARDG